MCGIRHTLLLLLLTLMGAFVATPGAVASAMPPAACDGEFEQELLRFESARDSGTFDERRAAVKALIATGEPAALTVIADELSGISLELNEALSEVLRLEYDRSHRRRLIGDLERRSESDASLEESLENQRRSLTRLEREIASQAELQAAHQPWLDFLRTELAAYAPMLDSSVRIKIEKQLWMSVGAKTGVEPRIASLEVLGCIGRTGTALKLQNFIAGCVKKRTKLEKSLVRQMRGVLKMEVRLQEEVERLEGRTSKSFNAQYDQVRVEARATQSDIDDLQRLCHAGLDAGARSLVAEFPEDREKSVKSLVRAQKKGRDGTRRLTLQMLGRSGLPEVRSTILALLAEEEDALVSVNMIDALADPTVPEGNMELEAYLLESGLEHRSWLVRGRSARALAHLRTGTAIPRLIERMSEESGRTLDDVQAALRSLTGQNFRDSAPLWDRWWKANEQSFAVPTEQEAKKLLAELEESRRTGSGFFGIESDSQRILFVVGLSGSMKFAMLPRDNPEDDIANGRRPDLPQDGEASRLEEAKIALKASLAGLKEGGTFNIIFYATNVWSWKPKLTATTESAVADALRAVDEMQAGGGTNIYGALRMALDMAGVKSSDFWDEPEVDTIFFLSDGRASMGLVTDVDEILTYVRERNASAGIAIHAIGLSGAQDAHLLRRLAEENGGLYAAR